jgi:hypothetical protein
VEILPPVMLAPLTFTASYRAEPGNDFARDAAHMAQEVARIWIDGQS